jgi:hypothetical protein
MKLATSTTMNDSLSMAHRHVFRQTVSMLQCTEVTTVLDIMNYPVGSNFCSTENAHQRHCDLVVKLHSPIQQDTLSFTNNVYVMVLVLKVSIRLDLLQIHSLSFVWMMRKQ